MIKKEDEKILKCKDLIIEIQCMWNVKARVIMVIIEINWNHVRITHTVPGQHSRKAQNLGITQNSHIRHCKHTMESANVKVQNIFHWLYYITCSTRTAAELNTLET